MPPVLASILIFFFLRRPTPALATKPVSTCPAEKAAALVGNVGVHLADILTKEAVPSSEKSASYLLQMAASRVVSESPKLKCNETTGSSDRPHHKFMVQIADFLQTEASLAISGNPVLKRNDTIGTSNWQDLLAADRILGDDSDECTIASSSFDYGVQLLLFLICMGSLLLKWHLEVPQRRLITFSLDVSQQVCAAGLYHLLNMIFAAVLSDVLGDHADACAMYWISFVLDTSIGVFFTCGLLWTARNYLGYVSGHYYTVDGKDVPASQATMENFDANKWIRQIGFFCAIIVISKTWTSIIVFSALDFWSHVGKSCTEWIDHPQLRLLWVMMITPAIMDTFCFWVTDEFIKHDGE